MQLYVSIEVCLSLVAMQLICGEDVSSAEVDEWTGRVMQQHTLNMAT